MLYLIGTTLEAEDLRFGPGNPISPQGGDTGWLSECFGVVLPRWIFIKCFTIILIKACCNVPFKHVLTVLYCFWSNYLGIIQDSRTNVITLEIQCNAVKCILKWHVATQLKMIWIMLTRITTSSFTTGCPRYSRTRYLRFQLFAGQKTGENRNPVTPANSEGNLYFKLNYKCCLVLQVTPDHGKFRTWFFSSSWNRTFRRRM